MLLVVAATMTAAVVGSVGHDQVAHKTLSLVGLVSLLKTVLPMKRHADE